MNNAAVAEMTVKPPRYRYDISDEAVAIKYRAMRVKGIVAIVTADAALRVLGTKPSVANNATAQPISRESPRVSRPLYNRATGVPAPRSTARYTTEAASPVTTIKMIELRFIFSLSISIRESGHSR